MQVMDEGILDLSELDGFLTTVAGGPRAVVPSTWMNAVWGSLEPKWESPERAKLIVELMTRHMNSIAGSSRGFRAPALGAWPSSLALATTAILGQTLIKQKVTN